MIQLLSYVDHGIPVIFTVWRKKLQTKSGLKQSQGNGFTNQESSFDLRHLSEWLFDWKKFSNIDQCNSLMISETCQPQPLFVAKVWINNPKFRGQFWTNSYRNVVHIWLTIGSLLTLVKHSRGWLPLHSLDFTARVLEDGGGGIRSKFSMTRVGFGGHWRHFSVVTTPFTMTGGSTNSRHPNWPEEHFQENWKYFKKTEKYFSSCYFFLSASIPLLAR